MHCRKHVVSEGIFGEGRLQGGAAARRRNSSVPQFVWNLTNRNRHNKRNTPSRWNGSQIRPANELFYLDLQVALQPQPDRVGPLCEGP